VAAHAEDLRAEVAESKSDADEWARQIADDYRRADLADVDRALCDHAVKLTSDPASITKKDVDHLRSLGLTDEAIHDATQVIAYFNYINRIADGLGVDPEQEMDGA